MQRDGEARRGKMQCRRILYLAVLMVFLAPIWGQGASAVYEVQAKCPGNLCLEESPISFTIKLYQLNLTVRYTRIDFLELIGNRTFASKPDLNLVVTPKANTTLEIAGFVPSVPKNFTAQIVPCFWLYALDSSNMPVTNLTYLCGKFPMALRIYKEIELQCSNDTECPSQARCIGSMCRPIECPYCHYAADHTCLPYECCGSQECRPDSICVNNVCTPIECRHDEIIQNRRCVKLECAEDEYPENRACVKLMCQEDEVAMNHACIPLNCGFDEAALSHQCVKITCKPNEVLQNKQCVELKCGIFFERQGRSCAFDWWLPLKILMGVSVLALLAYIIYLKKKQQPPPPVQMPPAFYRRY